jgi:LacI family transcriptional regulator
MADGAAATARLLDRRPVTAIFCANDVLAIGALETLARRGLAVPGDVSVVGFDDIPMASLSAIDLSTVAVDLDRLGRRAVRHLADRARDPEVVPTRVVEPVELRLRGTHGPARDY